MLAHEQIKISCGSTEAWRVSGRFWAGGMTERHSLVLWEGLYNVATAVAGAWGWCPCRSFPATCCWLASRLNGSWCNGKCFSLFTFSCFPMPVCPPALTLGTCMHQLARHQCPAPGWDFHSTDGNQEKLNCDVLAWWHRKWDGTHLSFSGPAEAILGSHADLLLACRALASHVSALLVCQGSCQPPF